MPNGNNDQRQYYENAQRRSPGADEANSRRGSQPEQRAFGQPRAPQAGGGDQNPSLSGAPQETYTSYGDLSTGSSDRADGDYGYSGGFQQGGGSQVGGGYSDPAQGSNYRGSSFNVAAYGQNDYGQGGYGQSGYDQTHSGQSGQGQTRQTRYGQSQYGQGQGGGSYGEGDFSRSAQRSQNRDDQNYGQSGGAYLNTPSGQGGSQAGVPDHEHHFNRWRDEQLANHDRDYHNWRSEQAKRYDQDYGQWRDERHQAFSKDFHEWRSSRPNDKAATSPTHAGSAAVGGGGDARVEGVTDGKTGGSNDTVRDAAQTNGGRVDTTKQ